MEKPENQTDNSIRIIINKFMKYPSRRIELCVERLPFKFYT